MALITTKNFTIAIESIAKEKHITHMDAVLHYCEQEGIEPESVSSLISKGLKEKIEANARDLNFLPRQAQLPIQTMEPIDVYLMYCAMKAHFSKNDYDFLTYKGKSRVPRNSFYKRKDRFFFVRLSKKYEDYEDIKNYLVANFIVDKKGYVANFNDENYKIWKEKRNNFYNIFTEEIRPFVNNFNPIFEVKNSEHPIILKEYLGKRVSLETLIILDELVGFTKTWNNRMSEDYIWYDLKKLMKNYKRFLTIDKGQYRIQLLKLIEESSNE